MLLPSGVAVRVGLGGPWASGGMHTRTPQERVSSDVRVQFPPGPPNSRPVAERFTQHAQNVWSSDTVG